MIQETFFYGILARFAESSRIPDALPSAGKSYEAPSANWNFWNPPLLRATLVGTLSPAGLSRILVVQHPSVRPIRHALGGRLKETRGDRLAQTAIINRAAVPFHFHIFFMLHDRGTRRKTWPQIGGSTRLLSSPPYRREGSPVSADGDKANERVRLERRTLISSTSEVYIHPRFGDRAVFLTHLRRKVERLAREGGPFSLIFEYHISIFHSLE